MATRQIFIDDIDGSEDGVETVSFGLDGTTYEIDLGSVNQDRLRAFLDDFVACGRPLGRDGTPARRRRPAGRVNRKAQAAAAIAEETAAIPTLAELPVFEPKLARKWLREHDYEVPDRGRIRAEVAMPYLESDEFKAWQEQQQ